MQCNLMDSYHRVHRRIFFLCSELAKYIMDFNFVLPFITRGQADARADLDGGIPRPPCLRLICARAVLHGISAQGHCCKGGA